MNCQQVQPRIADYSVGLLRARDMGLMKTHLESCAACGREWREFQAAIGLVEQFGAVEPPPHLWNGVYNRITADVTRERPSFWERLLAGPRRTVVGAATGLAAAAIV